jgi:predicted MPP superfamily phosphohydrolase
MKHTAFIIFLSVVLTLYSLMNFYVIRRGLQALPAHGWPRGLFLLLIISLAAAYPLGRWIERSINSAVGNLLIQVGAYYIALLVFAMLVLLIVDLVRFADHFFAFTPATWRGGHNGASLKLFLLVSAVVGITTLTGAINARYPRVRHLALEFEKPAPVDHLRLVLATDIHLGTLIHNSRMEELVELINAQAPDLILFGGDLFDEDVLSLSRQNMAEVLRKLSARHGIYAIPGNHEHISGIGRAIEYMESAGITVLRDRAVKAAGAVWLIGREDRQATYFGAGRLGLDELMATVDKNEPLILLDHQPFHLEEAEQQGIDLQLSGHTHHGQFFPFNYITESMYEVSWGYLKKGRTHYYVSCGAGTWGPPVRLGNRPEIVVIDLTFSPRRD